MAKKIETEAKVVDEGVVLPPAGEMVVGPIKVAPDLSPERLAGQPATEVRPLPLTTAIRAGDWVFLKISLTPEITRPLLVLGADYTARTVSGQVFFAPFDGTYEGPLTRLRTRLSNAGLMQHVLDVREGAGLWEWSIR